MEKLPVEILHLIGSFTKKQTLLRLRAVSQEFECVFTPLVITRHQINITRYRPLLFSSLHDPLPEAFIPYIHTLTVHLDDFFLDPRGEIVVRRCSELRKFSGVRNLVLSWAHPHDIHPEATNYCQALLDNLLMAVLSATNYRLEGLKLCRASKEDDGWLALPLSLAHIRGLTSLWLFLGCRPQSEGCRSSPGLSSRISDLLQKNPGIRLLQLENLCSKHRIPLQELHALQHLRRLTISGVSSVPHAQRHRNSANLVNLQHLKIMPSNSNQSSSTMDELWASLWKSETTLKTLETGNVSYALLAYLSSFKGLKSLTLTLDESLLKHEERIRSAAFFGTISMHGETLKEFSIVYQRKTKEQKPIDENLLEYYNHFAAFSQSSSSFIPPSFPALRSLRVLCSTQSLLSTEYCQRVVDYLSPCKSLRNVQLDWLAEMLPSGDLTLTQAFAALKGTVWSKTGRPGKVEVVCGPLMKTIFCDSSRECKRDRQREGHSGSRSNSRVRR